MNLLLFAGTTEGRVLAEQLRPLPLRAVVCVATEYAAELLGGGDGRFRVRVGRMDADAMRALMLAERVDRVVDATHPYAVEASANIRAAAAAAGVAYLRLARAASPAGGAEYFDSARAAAEALAATEGNVLLATGVKELAAFAAVPGFAGRMHPRVLPTEESVRACAELGFARARITAMQGPFGRGLNAALMRHFGIRILVTKDGGAEGGFPEKILAAEDCGVRVFVIGRPREDAGADEGMDMPAILAAVAAGTGTEGGA